jgi:uncharacterized protein (TIGR02466 family)
MNVAHLFPTMVSTFDFSKDPELPVLLDLIKNYPTQEHLLLTGGVSSYYTETRILNDPKIAGIASRIQQSVDQYIDYIGVAPVDISVSWFNVLGKNQRVKHHRHEISVVSGAFYVEADEGSVGLTFNSPLAPLRMYEFVQNVHDLNNNFVTMPCQSGMLVLFPSWLEHFTNANETDNRITVSFNTKYRYGIG